LSSSALANASNTMRAGLLMVRVTTTSRSDFRFTVVRFFTGPGLLSILAFIALLLSCQFLDNLVQLVEAFVPALAVPLEPRRLFLQSARAQLARPHAPDLLRGDEPACSKTPTCFFMPVSVMWNFSARSVIEASARPSCSRTPRRVALQLTSDLVVARGFATRSY
jgi:hypothetical protein